MRITFIQDEDTDYINGKYLFIRRMKYIYNENNCVI